MYSLSFKGSWNCIQMFSVVDWNLRYHLNLEQISWMDCFSLFTMKMAQIILQ